MKMAEEQLYLFIREVIFPPSLLRKIASDIGLTIDDFLENQ